MEYPDEQKIRERAYELWHAAGCPPDRAEEFWQLAEHAERAPVQPAETGAPGDPATFAGF